jgi:transposase-like protein
VIAVAARWYLRYGLSYRDVEESNVCTYLRLLEPSR